MRSRAARVRSMPLRSRLAMLVTAAVACAVGAVVASSWLLVRGQLQGQLEDSLRSTDTWDQAVAVVRSVDCLPQPPRGPDARQLVTDLSASVQLVLPDGGHCWVDGAEGLPVTQADLDVTMGRRESVLHVVTTASGVRMQVLTRLNPTGYVNQPVAISVARPLTDIDDSLNRLALILLAVAGLGVVGSGAAGLWVARTGLKPVDELTRAVERVARTEDLTVRIPAEGDDDIARLSRSFNAMAGALASSRDLQQQLIADAGHELRTPLTSLRTNIELLARSERTGRAIPPADRKALHDSLQAQMTELAALVDDLQELSRPDTGGGERLKVVPLHDVARAAVERARLRGGPELSLVTEMAPWYVRADPAALERAVVNVLDNAVKFSPPGASVEVRLTDGVLTVRDHGPGIPTEELPYVFDPFWRSPPARGLPGSGLGLCIVARTVQQCGGQVALGPADGGGTVARLSLPGTPTPSVRAAR